MNYSNTAARYRSIRLIGLLVLFLVFILANAGLTSAQTDVVVTPATINSSGLSIYVTRGNTSLNPETSTGRYSFGPGPGTPPLGSGSLHMPSGSGTGSGNGGRVWVGATDLNGTLLSAVSTLEYSSYIASRNGTSTAPSLNLYVDLDNNGTWEFASDALLVYEPYWNWPGMQPPTGQWQTWNAATGRWWDTRNKLAGGGGGGACNRTFAEMLAGTNPAGCSTVYPAYPNARIVSPFGSLPGLLAVTGDSTGSSGWVNFDGYLDALNTGVNRYNFEAPSVVYVDPAWAGTAALTASGLAAIRTPFGTSPFVATCPGLTPNFYGLDGFDSQSAVTAALGAGYTGLVQTCLSFPTNTPILPTSTGTVTALPPTATGTAVPPAAIVPTTGPIAPLCNLIGGGTNSVVRANVPDNTVTRGSVFCQVIVEHRQYIRTSAEIGIPEVIALEPIQAVEVFGLLHTGDSSPDFNNSITVCLMGSGRMIYLSALQAPRVPSWLPATPYDNYTCTSIPDAGTVVLVP
ncbi:MAG: hypothetical protein IAE89_01115 [Anaerolineae bacterium]|nr:hypothetical protein [Anaerolineae bacterium]